MLVEGLAGWRVRRLFVIGAFGLAGALQGPCMLAQEGHTADAPGMIEGPQTPGNTTNMVAVTGEPALMNNDSVRRMVKAGLGTELILQTVDTQPGKYQLDADSVIALKEAGVPETVISTMMNRARRQLITAPETPVVVADVNEPGVYYKDSKGRWTLMETEIVHVKSGGFVKSTLTHGIIKEDRNGAVSGREAKLLLPRPAEFMIYTPESVSVGEYDLLRFRLNSKDREFRTLTGGVIHSTGGAERDEVKFTPVKIAPHAYSFTLDAKTKAGEYGVLPPGTGNVTNGGKIYTFAIKE